MEQLEERMEDLRDQRSMAVAKDEDEEVIKLLDQQLARLRERKRHYEETLPKQVEAAQAAERAAEALRRQREEAAELEKKLAAAREKLYDMAQRQRETERENYLSGLDTNTQIELRLADATAYGQARHTIETLRQEMQDILNKPIVTPEDTARYEKLASTYNKIVELQRRGREEAERTAETERRRAEEAAKQEQARQRAASDYDMAVKMLRAEIAGNEKRLEVLKQQQRITQLAPNCAENKGSHAFVVFRPAMIPFVQAIAGFGVTDMSFSRIHNHCDLHAYGLFFSPLFTQHRYNGGNAPEPAHRYPEYFLHHKSELNKRFPMPTQQTRLLAKPAPRFWLFANYPQVDEKALEIAPDDVLVFLNRAKPFEHLKHLPNRCLLIVRRNARDKNWFIPYGHEKDVFGLC